jgi:hypothetical protein
MGLLLPSQASAGGWWTWPRLDRSTVAPGQRVKVSVGGLFTASTPPGPSGPAFVYLLRGLDDSVVQRAMRTARPVDWWSRGDAEAIPAGRFPTAGGRAAFAVPDVEPGVYDVMLCDAGCRYPLGDVIPTTLRVVADPLVANHALRLERAEARLDRHARRLARSQVTSRGLEDEIEQLQADLHSVRSRARDGRTPILAYSGWLLAGFALGVFTALAARHRGAGGLAGETVVHTQNGRTREPRGSFRGRPLEQVGRRRR